MRKITAAIEYWEGILGSGGYFFFFVLGGFISEDCTLNYNLCGESTFFFTFVSFHKCLQFLLASKIFEATFVFIQKQKQKKANFCKLNLTLTFSISLASSDSAVLILKSSGSDGEGESEGSARFPNSSEPIKILNELSIPP